MILEKETEKSAENLFRFRRFLSIECKSKAAQFVFLPASFNIPQCAAATTP